MKIPLKYTFRNLQSRRLTTALTILGVTLVVFVFAAVLMMANGVEKTLVATGSEENILISRKASNGEISSIIDGETVNIILAMNQVARTPAGTPFATKDVATVINLPKTDYVGITNVTVRGVSPDAFALRPMVKIVEGRTFQWGAREIIIGNSIARRILGAHVGGTIKIGGDQWAIVGRFDAEGCGFDSEIWGDVLQLTDALGRSNAFSTLTLKLRSLQEFDSFKEAFKSDARLQQFVPKTERQFFEEQSETMALFIRVLGIFITVIFSAGAVIGAMITMYGAVANRTVEIGTLRALGFHRRSVLSAYLIESLMIALIGGIVGLMLASFLQFFSISTINFDSFAEIEFSFALSTGIVISSLLFAIVMGFVGGFLPAFRAARLNIVSALRAS
ncbi:MAG: ABC transporter permease [Bacteroidetes bacterium]|nr:ABC transporter permease [Bacteroidota bacterium]MCW5897138.1 ABC transporter permease [Bacteroidota bacterium]